jgi:hypothetical protein
VFRSIPDVLVLGAGGLLMALMLASGFGRLYGGKYVLSQAWQHERPPMRPMFTIHAGEYLVGLYVQQRLGLNVWILAKDTGIDLLLTDRENRRTVSLQAKYGKDFLPGKSAVFRDSLRCLSWFPLNRNKLNASQAEFWIFVLHGFKSKEPDFVVVPTADLRQRMMELHNKGTLHIYLCSTGSNLCWETRGLRDDMLQLEEGVHKNPLRDFTQYLNVNGWARHNKETDSVKETQNSPLPAPPLPPPSRES